MINKSHVILKKNRFSDSMSLKLLFNITNHLFKHYKFHLNCGIYMLSVDITLWQFSWKNIIAYNSWKKEAIATNFVPDM